MIRDAQRSISSIERGCTCYRSSLIANVLFILPAFLARSGTFSLVYQGYYSHCADRPKPLARLGAPPIRRV